MTVLAVPTDANGTVVPTPIPSFPPLGPVSATATFAIKISGVSADILNNVGAGLALTASFGHVMQDILADYGVHPGAPSSDAVAYLTPDATGAGALVIATAGFPQLVDGTWPLAGAMLNALLGQGGLMSAFVTMWSSTLRLFPALAGYPIVVTLDGASSAPGAPGPGVPAIPSVAPYPVAQVATMLQFIGLPASNVSLADVAALCDALVYDLSSWTQAALPAQLSQYMVAPEAVVLAGASDPTGSSDLQIAVTSNVFGFPALANVLASALRPLLAYPATQANIIPTTLALATAVMGRTPGAAPPAATNATVSLISVAAKSTNPAGGAVLTPLPSPAAPTTTSTLTFTVLLSAPYAAVSADSSLCALLSSRLASAVAFQLSQRMGTPVASSDVTVTIAAAASAASSAISSGGALALASSGDVLLTAAVPIREAVPGTAALYADAASAAFHNSPTLLAPVSAAASAALGQPVTATVTSASAGPSQPISPGPGSPGGGNGGAVAGGVIGGLLLAAALLAGGVFAVRRSRARAAQQCLQSSAYTSSSSSAMAVAYAAVSDVDGSATAANLLREPFAQA